MCQQTNSLSAKVEESNLCIRANQVNKIKKVEKELYKEVKSSYITAPEVSLSSDRETITPMLIMRLYWANINSTCINVMEFPAKPCLD